MTRITYRESSPKHKSSPTGMTVVRPSLASVSSCVQADTLQSIRGSLLNVSSGVSKPPERRVDGVGDGDGGDGLVNSVGGLALGAQMLRLVQFNCCTT